MWKEIKSNNNEVYTKYKLMEENPKIGESIEKIMKDAATNTD